MRSQFTTADGHPGTNQQRLTDPEVKKEGAGSWKLESRWDATRRVPTELALALAHGYAGINVGPHLIVIIKTPDVPTLVHYS